MPGIQVQGGVDVGGGFKVHSSLFRDLAAPLPNPSLYQASVHLADYQIKRALVAQLMTGGPFHASVAILSKAPHHPLHHFLVIVMHKKPVEAHRSMMAALIAQEIKRISIIIFII